MKAKIDDVLCTGHGRCYVLAERVYRLDEEGYNADRGSAIDVPAGLEADARRGAQNCPEGAIVLIDDESTED
jgi:ferredoxin